MAREKLNTVMLPHITRAEFLRRCGNAFDAGLATPEHLRLMEQWIDFVMRFEGGQMGYVADFMEMETRRLEYFHRTLANDKEGYALVQFAAILTHPCQLCAEDPKAWWTRTAFCPHKGKI